MEEALLPENKERKGGWWWRRRQRQHGRSLGGELKKKVGSIATPMVVVTVSQYLLQVVSMSMAGHLGEVSLSSTAIAASFTNVTGFSLLVKCFISLSSSSHQGANVGILLLPGNMPIDLGTGVLRGDCGREPFAGGVDEGGSSGRGGKSAGMGSTLAIAPVRRVPLPQPPLRPPPRPTPRGRKNCCFNSGWRTQQRSMRPIQRLVASGAGAVAGGRAAGWTAEEKGRYRGWWLVAVSLEWLVHWKLYAAKLTEQSNIKKLGIYTFAAMFSLILLQLYASTYLFCWALVFKTDMGNCGAALAIGLSYWLNAILLGFYLKYSAATERTSLSFSKEVFLSIGEFFRFAVPSAVMVCLEWWSSELLVLLSGLLPNAQLETSVLSICLTIASLHFYVPYSFGAAASTRVSNELGAGNPEAARLSIWAVMVLEATEVTIAKHYSLLLPLCSGKCVQR
ncbi:MATE efflux family protein [Actinidia rufa]|uniref:Protein DETOXIFICATION n=1 Tax=Actinidia rufa TaxID=165716 RepID=A0A7J0EK51_9ERIC|nr:MATE efflux family protein [Actinidia rufa]